MMSTLLTTTMLEMKKTIQALQKAGLRDEVKVVIGGAPICERYATRSALTDTQRMPLQQSH